MKKSEPDTPLKERMQAPLWDDPLTEQVTNLPRRARRELEQAGKFPAPVRLNQKRVLYVGNEVLDWIEQNKAARAKPRRRRAG